MVIDEGCLIMAENVETYEPPGGRWMIVIVGLIIQLCLGAIYAYGVLRTPLLNHFKGLGLDPSAMAMTWPFIVFLAMFA